MATADRTAPTEAQSVPFPSVHYEDLNNRLLDLICRFRILGHALEGGRVSHQDAALDAQGATEALDRFQEDLEAWYEDCVQAPAGAALEALRSRNLELVESHAQRIVNSALSWPVTSEGEQP